MLGIYPHIYKKLQYDPVADLTPVSLGAQFDLGSVPHFIGVLIGRSAGVDLKHVPYRGTQRQSSRSGSRPTPERPAHRKSLRASTMH